MQTKLDITCTFELFKVKGNGAEKVIKESIAFANGI